MVVVKQKKHRVPPPPPPPPAPMMMQPPAPVPPPPPQMYTYSYQQQQRRNNVTNNQLGISSHGKQQQQQQLRGKQLQQVWNSSNTNNVRLPGKIIPRKQIQLHQHQQRSHHQKVKVVPPPPPPPSAAAPLPPPPPQIQHFRTQQQQPHHGLGSGQNFPSFQSLKLSRTFSNDSSCLSNADSSITNSIIVSPTQRQIQEQDPGLLSPKLRAYLNNMVTTSGSGTGNNATGGPLAGNRNRSSRNNATSTSSSSIAKQEKNDHHHFTKHVLFSPSNLSDTSSKESNDEADVTVLHSIFSPNFHAVSAKKKKKKQQQSHHHHQKNNLLGEGHALLSQQLASSALLSPVVVSNNDFSIDVNSVTSDMSDEFGTIHAILRGDTLENIKKHVGLDVEHHPLSPNMTQVIKNGMGAVVAADEGNMGVAAVQGEEEKVDGVRLNGFIGDHAIDATQLLTTNKGEEIDVDDSTEVMLDKARLLTGKALQHNQPRGDQLVGDDNEHLRVVIFTSPSAGNSKDSQQLQQQSAIKTPKVTPPANTREDDEDEFFTPSSSMKPNHSFVTARAASSPMALNFDLATTTNRSMTAGGSNGLEPVLEEEEMKAKSGHVKAWEDAYQQRFPALGEEESLEEDVNMGDFRTPKQQYASNQDEYEDDDEEEFFSPLVQHAVHTPASKKLDYQQTDSMLSVTQSVEALSSNIPTPSALPVSNKDSSPNYSEVKQELQSMLKKAKDLSSPSKEQQGQPEQPSFISEMDNLSAIETPLPTSNSLNYSIYSQGANSSIPQSPSFHLHSPSVSSLPRDALTVDFVKQCEDVEILHAIHSLLCDNDNSFSSRNSGKVWGGKQGKQLRYPSLVRLVEKRLQKMEVESLHEIEEEKKEEEQGQQVVHLKPRIAVGMKAPRQSSPRDGVDKENVNPEPLLLHSNELRLAADPVADGDLTPGSAAPPMESITVLHDSNTEGSVEKEQGAVKHPSRPPSPMSEGLSSLDMNLSESLFTLENESHYWQYSVHSSEGADNKDGDKEHKRGLISEVNVGAKQLKHMETQTEVEEGSTHPSYSELNEKLAATLLSNAKLTGEVDSLVKEQLDAKADLTSKLRIITEQMSNLKFAASTQKDTYEKRMSDLDALNCELQDEIHLLNQNAEDRLSQLTSELAEANVRNTALAQEKSTLQQELNKMRKEASRLKLMLDKKNSMAVNENTEKLQRVVDSAKLANKALANALAVSEKDLAEANEAKEKSAHECNALQERAAELEDKTAFLSSQVKDLSTELKSSHAYIDRLYTEANTRSPSKELKSEFEQKEREWMELESKYSQKIQELESRLVYDSKNQRVSMDAYMEVVKMTRQFKFESTEKDKTIGELKTNVVELRTKLDRMQMPTPTVNKIGGGKTIKVLQSMVKSKQVSPGSNDENVAPLPPPPTPAPIQTDTDNLGAKKVQLPQGKQLNRVAAVKAAGGRKGLSEQLRRARRFGGKTHNVKQD